MADQWYYWDENGVTGPVPMQEIVNLAQIMVIAPETMVRHGEEGDWIAAAQAPMLAGMVHSTVAPAPSAPSVRQAKPAPLDPAQSAVEPPRASANQPRPSETPLPKAVQPRSAEGSARGNVLMWSLLGGGVATAIVLTVVVIFLTRSGPASPPLAKGNTGPAQSQNPRPAPPTPEPRPADPPSRNNPEQTVEPAKISEPPKDAVAPKQESPKERAPSQATLAAEAALFDFLPSRKDAPQLSGQQVYERLLKSCVLILNPDGSSGSGSLIDAANRLVVTNHHVVHSEKLATLDVGGKGTVIPGRLSRFSPRDFVRGTYCYLHFLRMSKGEKTVIELMSPDFDPFLRLEDSQGRRLMEDDDSGFDLSARLTFLAPKTDTYRIVATSFDNRIGAFLLRISQLDGKEGKRDKGDEGQAVYVAFPRLQDGKLVTDSKSYLGAIRADKVGYQAKVIYADPVKDLALVQLNQKQVPAHAQALPLAKDSGKPGQSVHSIGNPGASQSLWVYTSGTVRTNPHVMKWTSIGATLQRHDAMILETQSPTNPGDSGGPLVNDAGEMIAVTQGGNARANAVNIFIDVSEVKTILKSKGYKWSEGVTVVAKPPAPGGSDILRLAQLLEHASPRVRVQAANYLAMQGALARPAVIALGKAVGDSSADVGRSAAFALAAVGPEGLPGLSKALRDGAKDLRIVVAQALGQMGPAAQSAEPALLEALADTDRDVNAAVLDAMAKIQVRSSLAIGELLNQLSENPDAELQQLAGQALEKVLEQLAKSPQNAGDVLPVLMKIYTGKAGKTKDTAAAALESLGPALRPIVPELLAIHKAAQGGERIDVLRILARGCDAPDKEKIVTPAALQLVADNDDKVKMSALSILQSVGPDGKGSTNEVLNVYAKGRAKELRAQALRTLGAQGIQAKAATPRLLEDVMQASASPADKELADAAIQTLAKIGEPAVKALLKLAGDSKYQVRLRAVDVLGDMGPEVREFALTPLLRLYNDVEQNPTVRERMKKAIERIRAN